MAEYETPSALKELRRLVGKSQGEVARETGFSRVYVTQFEQGTRPMTWSAAQKIAPAVNVSAEDLMMGETVCGLERAAVKGELDPARVARQLAALDDAEVNRNLVDALLGVVKTASETYKLPAAHADLSGPLGGASLKSGSERRGRDKRGLKREKSFAPERAEKREEGEGPRRDRSGKRLNKPFGGGSAA